MGFQFTGVVTNVRPIVDPNGQYQFYALDLATMYGTKVGCMVSGSDPQYQRLFDAGEQLMHHKVKVSVLNYSTSVWKQQDGTERPQLRLRVTNIRDLGLPQDDSELTGFVTSARDITSQDGSFSFLAIDIVTERGATYACQIWEKDPEYLRLGPVVSSLVDHKVQVSVLSMNVGKRVMKDRSEQLQARFRITNVRDLGLPQEDVA
jgi:hypothetical protein